MSLFILVKTPKIMSQICLVLFLVLTLSGGFPLEIFQANAADAAEQPSAKSPPPETAALEKHSLKVTSEYYIGPEDVLEIIVWKNAELSKVVSVRPDGRISLPLLGDIDAIGLTLQAITGAGGFAPTAARNKIVVFRWDPEGNKEIKLKASYDDIVMRDGSSQNLVMKPGDTIVVPSETMVLTQ